jgi:hypothetical protein
MPGGFSSRDGRVVGAAAGLLAAEAPEAGWDASSARLIRPGRRRKIAATIVQKAPELMRPFPI